MQATVKPEEQGSIVSTHYFFLTAVGCASTIVLGSTANRLGAVANPKIYGQLICLWQVIGHIGGMLAQWKAGNVYKKQIEEIEAREATA